MKIRHLLFLQAIFLFSIILSSCASTKNEVGSDISPVYVTNTKKFYLLPSNGIEKNVDDLYLLTGEFGKSSFTLLAYVQADENGIFVSLMNDFGASMGTLIFDGEKVTLDSEIFPKNLKPEYIVSDLQFAFYKPSVIKKNLSSIKMNFEVAKENKTEVRTIINRRLLTENNCVEKIEKTADEIKIENYLRGYTYNLQKAEN